VSACQGLGHQKWHSRKSVSVTSCDRRTCWAELWARDVICIFEFVLLKVFSIIYVIRPGYILEARVRDRLEPTRNFNAANIQKRTYKPSGHNMNAYWNCPWIWWVFHNFDPLSAWLCSWNIFHEVSKSILCDRNITVPAVVSHYFKCSFGRCQSSNVLTGHNGACCSYILPSIVKSWGSSSSQWFFSSSSTGW
jgi:hypothetical protein